VWQNNPSPIAGYGQSPNPRYESKMNHKQRSYLKKMYNTQVIYLKNM